MRTNESLKAKLLIDSFKKAIWKNGNPNHIDQHAKECAITCVGQILKLTDGLISEYDYWNKVLEILKAK